MYGILVYIEIRLYGVLVYDYWGAWHSGLLESECTAFWCMGIGVFAVLVYIGIRLYDILLLRNQGIWLTGVQKSGNMAQWGTGIKMHVILVHDVRCMAFGCMAFGCAGIGMHDSAMGFRYIGIGGDGNPIIGTE